MTSQSPAPAAVRAPPATQRLRIAFVGHVDHGKSTLIGQLLRQAGVLPADLPDLAFATDHFSEERDGLMSLDTAQAFCRLGGRELTLIDVPGHRELIRNMITGVTRADAAVLVLAADEGVREQTRRHATVLSLLGVSDVIVAVNKMDRVAYDADRFDALRDEVFDLLARSNLSPACVVPVCATRGCNVAAPSNDTPWYLGPTLLAAITEVITSEAAHQPARFIVQGVYSFDRRPAYAGRLLCGSVSPGDRLLNLPTQREVVVESILRFPENHDPMQAGECAAVALELAPGDTPPIRGAILSAVGADAPPAGRRIAGRVFWWRPEPLKPGERLRIRVATQLSGCVVESIANRINTATLQAPERPDEHLHEAELADVVLTADDPLVAEPMTRTPALGRFLLETGGSISGAGIIP